MRILYVFALIGVIVSITTFGGILAPALALAQPNDNNLTRTTSNHGLEGNLTSNLGSNLSNATAPANIDNINDDIGSYKLFLNIETLYIR